jgi:hypothetical protein
MLFYLLVNILRPFSVICCILSWMCVGYVWLFGMRHYYVHKFLTGLLVDMQAWNLRHLREVVAGKEKSAFEWAIAHTPSYKKLLFSFRPLKREKWIPADILLKLNS